MSNNPSMLGNPAARSPRSILSPAEFEISVVIPTFNRCGRGLRSTSGVDSLLGRCLSAVFAQEFPSAAVEVIVVNDGSTDSTGAFLASLDAPCALSCLNQPHAGAGAARNLGAARARGRVLLFLDDDVIAEPGLLQAHLEMHRTHPRSAIVGHLETAAWNHDPLLSTLVGRLQDRGARLQVSPHALTPCDLLTGHFSIERDLFLGLGSFESALPSDEDFELGLRLQDHGIAIRYCPGARATELYDRQSDVFVEGAYRKGYAHGLIVRKHARSAILLGLARAFEGPLLTRLGRWLVWMAAALWRFRLKPLPSCRAGAGSSGRFRSSWYRVLSGICYWSGFSHSFRSLSRLRRITRPRLPILGYHRVDEALSSAELPYGIRTSCFREQMRYLHLRGYRTITLKDWIEARQGARNLPERPIVITFDDGYRDTLTQAWPELRRVGFAATVFPVAGAIGSTNAWDRPLGFPERPILAGEDLRLLESMGAEIGSHGLTHRSLDEPGPDELSRELRGSKTAIEEHLDHPVTSLAYPYGVFNARIGSQARAAGYEAACTSLPGVNRVQTDPFELRRIFPAGRDSLFRFGLKLHIAPLIGWLSDRRRSLRSRAGRALRRAKTRIRQALARLQLLELLRDSCEQATAALCGAFGIRRFTHAYFERRFAKPDPWGFACREYERIKYRQCLEAIPPSRFQRGLELGCAEGLFTQALAGRCDSLLGVDISERALARARSRCSGQAHVRFQRLDLFTEPLAGEFDLVVCGEVLCFAESGPMLADACRKVAAWVQAGGYVLLVHLRIRSEHPEGWPAADLRFGADSIHARFRESRAWTPIFERRESRYMVSLYQRRPADPAS